LPVKSSHAFRLGILALSLFPLEDHASAQVLVDDSGEFDAFQQPAINDDGKVVFVGYKDVVGEEEQIGGVYTVTSGGAVQTIVDENGPFSGVDRPHITNNDQIFFYGAIYDEENEDIFGIFRGPNVDFSGMLGMDTVVDNIDPSVWDAPFNPGNCGQVSANDLGDVLFCGSFAVTSGARLGEPPPGCDELACEFREIAKPAHINTFFEMNNNRKVVFVETESVTDAKRLKLSDFSTDPPTTTTLIDTETDPFDFITNNVDINDMDEIAFLARKDPTSTFGVYTIKPGEAAKAVVPSGSMAVITIGAAINDMGQVAFQSAQLGGGFGRGYFVTPNLAEPIIQTGDALGNSEIIGFVNHGLPRTLNNKGELVIGALLENGIRTLALAQGSSPIDQIFWEGVDGDFSDTLNWDPQTVPDEEDVAVFDKDQTYTVSFSNAMSDRVFIERGTVTFSGGVYEAFGGDEVDASIVVGHDAADLVTLNLVNNHSLGVNHATLGEDPSLGGTLNIVEGSTLSVEGRLTVGKSSMALLDISDGGSVISAETQIGAESGGVGSVSVLGPSTKGIGIVWDTGNLAVGLAGIGHAGINKADCQSDQAVLGVIAGSSGTVEVNGEAATWNVLDNLTVGQAGEGHLTISNGAVVRSTSGEILDVASMENSNGSLRVSGPGSTLEVPNADVYVSAGGTARMWVENGAEVFCDQGIVGRFGNKTGALTIEEATWTSSGDFLLGQMNLPEAAQGELTLKDGTLITSEMNVEYTGAVNGIGTIITPTYLNEGTIAPGIDLFAPTKTTAPVEDEIGRLDIDGDFTVDEGTILISVRGTEVGDFDIIDVSGTVNILSATIVFEFIDGYLPKMGEEIPFLVSSVGLTTNNVILEYSGVAPGFQFDAMEENGILMFRALNDAEPNTNLPIADNPEADVNEDGIVDERDLLEVMENWYRIVSE